MIRLTLVSLLLASTLASPAGARVTHGTWTAYVKQGGAERLQFSMDLEPKGNMGMGLTLADFTGLTMEQVRSGPRVPVRFEMRREAGIAVLEGFFHDGRGAGEFTFTPNAAYRGTLERMGVEIGPNAEECDELSLAIFDVSTAFIRSMQNIGYKETLSKYVEFRIFKVDPAYVSAMADVGFAHLSADKLVETRIHNVTPGYIREMRAAGNDLTLDEYVQSRIFEVTPEFAEEMGRAGYRNLDHDTLVQFRIHNVTPEFVGSLRKLGYTRVPADQLVAMRIHNVTPQFIRRVEATGHHNVPVEKLIEMRIFNVDPETALNDDAR